MDPVPLIVPQALHRLIDFGERFGVRPSLPPRLIHGHAPVPMAYAGQLLEELATGSGTQSFGLRAGSASRFEDAPLASEIRGTRTVGAALDAITGASSKYCGGQMLSVTQRAGNVWVQRRFPGSLRRGRRQANDWALQMLLDVVRRGAGRDWRPSQLHLEGPPPDHAGELAELSAGSTRFGAAADCIVFPQAVLASRLCSDRVTAALRPTPLPDGDFLTSVRETIRCLLEFGELDLPTLAEAANTSVRSLHRRLGEAGLKFRRLADDARFDASCRLLRDPTIRITDIAVELGYTDAANFTRAFRRWAGVSPLAFRHSELQRETAG